VQRKLKISAALGIISLRPVVNSPNKTLEQSELINKCLNLFVEIEIKFQLAYNSCYLKKDLQAEENLAMTLTNLPIGAKGKVLSVNGNNRISKRLMEMGVIPGVFLRVIKSAPFGDPLEICVRGYHLAMRKSEADAIEVIAMETGAQTQQ